jgi:MFS family permease
MDGKRGWFVVFGGFVALSITSGVAFFVLPVLLGHIVDDTGWSFRAVSNAVAAWGLAAALFSPLCGMLIDKLGARRMILFGIALGVVTVYFTARATSLLEFYALLILSSISSMSCTFIPVAAVVARWFVKHRAMATGVAMLGTFVGGTGFPIAADLLLKNHSWRETYTIFGFVLAAAAIPTFLFVRDPGKDEESAYLAALGSPDHAVNDLTLAQALRGRSFWGLSVGDMLTGLVFAVFNIHLVYYFTQDFGNETLATRVFSALNLSLAAGTLLFGVLGDRLPLRGVLVSCYFFPAIAMPLLLIGGGAPLAFAFVILAGLPGGGRNALFPTALVYCFGETHLGAIYGLSNSFFMIGNAAGPAISAQIYESTGSTRAVYATCLGLLIVSAGLVALIRRKQSSS